MVRIIAGVLVRVGRGFYEPEKVKELQGEFQKLAVSRNQGSGHGTAARTLPDGNQLSE